MAAVPILEEEDARRRTRERENLVCERARIINRLKAAFTRRGVRNFRAGA
jgi:transposase